jgi:hypothetical protein
MAGTYQSRAFNFINGQANRVRNSLSHSWRRVKVSMEWTGQILWAPWRWLNRFSQDTKRQIASKDRDRLLIEQATALAANETSALTKKQSGAMTPNASRAIEALLAEVVAAGYGLLPSSRSLVPVYEDWSVIDENDWDTAYLDESNRSLTAAPEALSPPQPARPIIQGLATLLSNQHLVLIDQHNQVLDVLSPSQQLHIRQQIGPVIKQSLRAASSELTAAEPAARLAVTPPTIVLAPLPTAPQTVWQQMGYWWRYYLEYFQVDIGSNRDIDPDQPLLLESQLHKSLAVIPHSIASLSPEPARSSSSVSAMTDPPGIDLDVRGQNPELIVDIQTTSVPSRVTFQPEWIEAPTETLGYERSLLQQLWMWLDRLMLKIENWLISIYQQLKRAK